MAIEGFDYKEFAANMTEQAKQLVPQDLTAENQQYIVDTLSNFTLLAGEALYNDENLKLTAEQAVFITQVIAEWSYHKSIDLIRSGLQKMYWDSIMQKIAFTIFEVAKQAIIREIPQDQLLPAIEHHVQKVYNKCIEDLQNRGMISEKVKENAENQSNIDAMARKAAEEANKAKEATYTEADEKRKEIQKKREEARKKRKEEREAERAGTGYISKRQMKLMALAMILKILSPDKIKVILDKLEKDDVANIIAYMDIVNLESQIDSDILMECLKEIKKILPSKRVLTQENIMGDLLRLYKANSRDIVEKAIRNERPLVKRFIAQAYDGEYSGLPIKVAGIVAQHVEDSI